MILPVTSKGRRRTGEPKRNSSVLDSRSAFTLLELLVAVVLLSFVMIAVYSSWASVIRAIKVGENYAAQAQRSRVAIKAVEDSLSGTVLYGENVRYYSFVMDGESDFGALAFTSHLAPGFPGSSLFGDQALRRVTFTVTADPEQNRQNMLVMTQIPLLQETNAEITPYAITLARDVTLFVPEVWDQQKGEWATKWIATNQMPKQVRVTIGIGHAPGSRDPDQIISRVIYFPGTAIMGDVQRGMR